MENLSLQQTLVIPPYQSFWRETSPTQALQRAVQDLQYKELVQLKFHFVSRSKGKKKTYKDKWKEHHTEGWQGEERRKRKAMHRFKEQKKHTRMEETRQAK